MSGLSNCDGVDAVIGEPGAFRGSDCILNSAKRSGAGYLFSAGVSGEDFSEMVFEANRSLAVAGGTVPGSLA
jgi:hypothetical protein